MTTVDDLTDDQRHHLGRLVVACQDRRAARQREDRAIVEREHEQRYLLGTGMTARQVAEASERALAASGWTATDIEDAGVGYPAVRRARAAGKATP